jgi:mono/diheme cytochrome c family protein
MNVPQQVFVAALLAAGLGGSAATIRAAHSQPAPTHDTAGEGKRIFERANCMGCHKWHGNGGGGYGGDALSLRATELTREQIIEVVSCGRPGTGMPAFVRDAYAGYECYGGMTKKDLEDSTLAAPKTYLRPADVASVADYVIASIKGKGEPTYEQCIAFFGEGSRVCNTYR